MNLTTKPVQFRLHGASADLLDDVFRLRHPLAQRHAYGISDLHMNGGDRISPAFAHDLTNAAQVGAEVVGALQVCFQLTVAELREGQCLQDGSIPDSQAQAADDEPRNVLGLLGRSCRQKFGKV